MTVAEFAGAVVTFRAQTDATVTSWGRSRHVNRRYNAPDDSLHTVDLAVDVIYDQLPALETVRTLADGCGLTLRREAHHDHLEPMNGGA